MSWNVVFFVNSFLLGVGLAMDAFSVSLANGLNEPNMKKSKMILIAGVFAFFQALMPMIGWFLVHTLCSCFSNFTKIVPWIALILLSIIGIKMIFEGKGENENSEDEKSLTLGIGILLLQGIATSIDGITRAIEEGVAGVNGAAESTQILVSDFENITSHMDENQKIAGALKQETEIFKKGEMLYHYHIAREECRLKKSVIVMEGFMDVIRASTIGIKNTVALMGTALTKEQINLIKRLSNNIILCLDGDEIPFLTC